jgi:CubicO group peptidase (beta-lactamase class C family)
MPTQSERLRHLGRITLVLANCLVPAATALAIGQIASPNAVRAESEAGVQAEAEAQKAPLLADRDRFSLFEEQLDRLRMFLKIPGLSAAIVRDQEVVWAKGLGFADRDKRILATPETLYHVCSLTKTFAATMILRLVEQGKLHLEDPASRYTADVEGDRAQIRHLLSHTAEGTPGERFHYAGDPYWSLTEVIEKASGKSFQEMIVATFLEPLHMDRSVPGEEMLTYGDMWLDRLGKANVLRYQKLLSDLAQPYHLYGSEVVANPPHRPWAINAREGLITTVRDLAKYDAALDRHWLLRRETQEQAWRPAVSNGGQALPHGLGWFVQYHRGLKLVWHYGYCPNAYSALYLKVPERNLTFILLANSDGLSAPFYDRWGVDTSAFACAFLRLFVFRDGNAQTPPDPSWAVRPEEFARELARLRKQTDYPYVTEEMSHAAMTKWLAERQARARTPIRVDPDRLAAYVGHYRVSPDRVVTVQQERGGLTIDFPGKTRFLVLPWAEGKFFLKVLDLELTFARDEKGRVSTLEIDYEDRNYSAKKTD